MDNINSLIKKSTDIDVPGAAQLNLKDTGKMFLNISFKLKNKLSL